MLVTPNLDVEISLKQLLELQLQKIIYSGECMNYILKAALSIVLLALIVGCSSNNDPQVRIKNEQLNLVNVNLQTSENVIISFNNIETGQTTAYQKVHEGNITATDVIRNESVSVITKENTNYTIIISTNKPPIIETEKQ